jgi:peptidylprolyl isomerase
MATLAACSGTSGGSVASLCKPGVSVSTSSAVAVTGKFGAKPAVKLTTPVKATATQLTLLTKGTGDVVKSGGKVNIEYSVFNGTTGKAIGASTYAGSPEQVTVAKTSILPGMVKMLECSTVGSRIVAVIPPSDAFGKTGSTTVGVGATDSLVFVTDIVSVPAAPLPRATGTAQAPQDGFPTVVLDGTGAPTITVPKTAAPAAFKLEVLIKGAGPVVGPGANVTVNYSGVVWATGKTFDSSWAHGTPATFNTAQVVAGFKQALEGQTVGSQVVVVIPPALGYGTAGQPSAGIKGTDTLVFVVDILGV